MTKNTVGPIVYDEPYTSAVFYVDAKSSVALWSSILDMHCFQSHQFRELDQTKGSRLYKPSFRNYIGISEGPFASPSLHGDADDLHLRHCKTDIHAWKL